MIPPGHATTLATRVSLSQPAIVPPRAVHDSLLHRYFTHFQRDRRECR